MELVELVVPFAISLYLVSCVRILCLIGLCMSLCVCVCVCVCVCASGVCVSDSVCVTVCVCVCGGGPAGAAAGRGGSGCDGSGAPAGGSPPVGLSQRDPYAPRVRAKI